MTTRLLCVSLKKIVIEPYLMVLLISVMKNSFVSLGGLSPIQKHGAEIYRELCSGDSIFCVYSHIDSPDFVCVECCMLHKPFFTWLNRRKVFYSVYGYYDGQFHLVLV